MAQNESYYLIIGKFQYTLSPVHFEANFQAFMIDLSRYGGIGRNFVDTTNGGVPFFPIFTIQNYVIRNIRRGWDGSNSGSNIKFYLYTNYLIFTISPFVKDMDSFEMLKVYIDGGIGGPYTHHKSGGVQDSRIMLLIYLQPRLDQ